MALPNADRPGRARRGERRLWFTVTSALVLAVVVLGVMQLRSGDEGGPPPESPPASATPSTGEKNTIAVESNDERCALSRTELEPSTYTFKVRNSGTKVTEFYVNVPLSGKLDEVEDIQPGDTGELVLDLTAGRYEALCKPGMAEKIIRQPFVVLGKHATGYDGAQAAQAVNTYRDYVRAQCRELHSKTAVFVQEIKAGHLESARSLFAPTRVHYERIEPIVEQIRKGRLDRDIDERAQAFGFGEIGEQHSDWRGFHRLEYALWKKKKIESADKKMADRLLKDVGQLQASLQEDIGVLDIASGAKGLLSEIASKKISGEEDIYSGTDLSDFYANVEGAMEAVNTLRPLYEDKAGPLADRIDKEFALLMERLDEHRDSEGWVNYDKLTQQDRNEISGRLDAVAERVTAIKQYLIP